MKTPISVESAPSTGTAQPVNPPAIVISEKRTPPTDIGVIVGRFQVPYLHEAHAGLIQHVVEHHPRTIVVLGVPPTLSTRNNPLDYESRKQMVSMMFPDATIFYIKDCNSDALWSSRLDRLIKEANPMSSVTLYGGRDSFIKHYTGKLPTVELESDRFVSGTQLRNEACKRSKPSADFRAGVVHACYNRFPVTLTTVHVAIFNDDGTKILLCRKPDESEYRFVGGFSKPDSESFEADVHLRAKRVSVEVSEPQYLGSCHIEDWRLRGEADKVKAVLFAAKREVLSVEETDEFAEIRWFEIAGLDETTVLEPHRPLLELLRKKIHKHTEAPQEDLQLQS